MSRLGTGVTRRQWLEAGQHLLSKQGIEGVKLRALTKALQVSTGSFYYHFTDFPTYLKDLASYYAVEQLEERLNLAKERSSDDPAARIRELTRIVDEAGGRELTLAMRAWARHDKTAAKAVAQLDAAAFDFIQDAFLELNFSPDEAAARTLIIIAVAIAEPDPGILRKLPASLPDELLKTVLK